MFYLMMFSLVMTSFSYADECNSITEKTMVAWVTLDTPNQGGAGVLTTLDRWAPAAYEFDSMVMGEIASGKWMLGSEVWGRTDPNQVSYAIEDADPQTLVKIAIVIEGDAENDATVSIYRNDQLYASYSKGKVYSYPLDGSLEIYFGLRCRGIHGTLGYFQGTIEEARLYNEALNAATLSGLTPNTSTGPQPIGLWTFEDGTAADATGTFPQGILHGNAQIANGRLHLDGQSYVEVRPISPWNESVVKQNSNVVIARTKPVCGTPVGYNVYVDSNDLTLDATGFRGQLASPEFVLEAAQLQPATTYFWRIDPVFAGGVVETGQVWQFSTPGARPLTVKALYDMEGTDLDLLADASGNGKHMSRFPRFGIDPNAPSTNQFSSDVPSLVTGTTSGAQSLYLSGDAGYVIDEALTTTNDFVLEAYVKPSAQVAAHTLVAAVGGRYTGMAFGIGDNPGTWGGLLQNIRWMTSNTMLDADQWVHVALVRGSEFNYGKLTLLVNHEIVFETMDAPRVPSPSEPRNFMSLIGCVDDDPGLYADMLFRGYVDNVRFSTFSGALTMDRLMPKTWVPVYSPFDFNRDMYVDMLDFAEFAAAWMDCTDPMNAECGVDME